MRKLLGAGLVEPRFESLRVLAEQVSDFSTKPFDELMSSVFWKVDRQL